MSLKSTFKDFLYIHWDIQYRYVTRGVCHFLKERLGKSALVTESKNFVMSGANINPWGGVVDVVWQRQKFLGIYSACNM